MSSQVQTSQEQPKPNDKELNFRALEAKYQKELQQERAARMEAEKLAQERVKAPVAEEDDDDEPYVDKKKLNKTLARFGEQSQKQTTSAIQQAVQTALQEERKNNWLKSNPDFYDVLQLAEKLAMKDPDLAESILEMPEGFERQKLVYKTIKSQGIHKPEVKQASIQEKVDANRRSPYYQPSGVGAAPYQSSSDFSPAGQKLAHDKMQELKSRLRL